MLKKSQKSKNRIILQVRSNSKRLPLKSLRKIRGTPLGLICAKRLTNIKNDFIIASSNNKTDDKLCKIFQKNKMRVYRGSLDDVLSRYYKAMKKNDTDVIVRITADCPIVDHHLTDQMIKDFLKKDYDYYSNTFLTSFPDGFDVDILTKKCLKNYSDKLKAPLIKSTLHLL